MATTPTPADSGHAAHTKASEERGLPGEMPRPIKVVYLGAGSHFTIPLFTDLLHIPNQQGGTFCLVDTDAERLQRMEKVARLLAEKHGLADRWKIQATTERTDVLEGTDYLINTIDVGGVENLAADYDIPREYGIDQCIGDTIGPGGLFKSLRTIPVWLEVLRDAEEFCPEALVLNYTNPMAMMCLAGFRASSMQAVGLCHSVQGTSHLLAKRAGVPYPELDWECAGINHLAWFTKLRHKGQDLYPLLKEKAALDIAGNPSDPDDAKDLVRKDMMIHFGAFITESSGHLSEYLPYYRKRKDLLEKYARDRYNGESFFYRNNWPDWRVNQDKKRDQILSGEMDPPSKRSWEYASWIIEAREKNTPYRIHGNVYNKSGDGGTLITNLPADSCVEVATYIDGNGLNPGRYGELPRQMAAVCDMNLRMFDLGAQACIDKSKEMAIHALMVDPLTAAVLSPAEIREMTLKMFEAEAEWLPDFS